MNWQPSDELVRLVANELRGLNTNYESEDAVARRIIAIIAKDVPRLVAIGNLTVESHNWPFGLDNAR